MTALGDTLQRITVLRSVTEIFSRLDASVFPVLIRDVASDIAVGATFAADIIAPADVPQHASALTDGYAVVSDQTVDANSYSPTVLASAPSWVEAGARMPAGTDAILPVDAVVVINGAAEIYAPATQGEGVLPPRADAAKGSVLCRAGAGVRSIDVTILSALAIKTISVRVPRVKIVSVSVGDDETDMIAPAIASMVRASGGFPEIVRATLETIFAKPDADLIIAVGGTGTGKNDDAVKSLARLGNVQFHGCGISPGQTAAFGRVAGCPVLLLPGRLDAALAVFLIVGSRLMARLTGSTESETGLPVPLTKKVTSTIGLTEVVFVRRVPGGIEPLGNGLFPLQVLLQANGWILVSDSSEGVPAGTTVEMRSLP